MNTSDMPPIDPAKLNHWLAIQMVCPDGLRELVQDWARTMTPAEIRTAINWCARLSVPDAVSYLRVRFRWGVSR